METEVVKRQSLNHREMVKRYTNQRDSIPKELREELASSWGGGEPLQLYAYVDLDAKFRMTESWLCLSPSYLTLAKKDASGEWQLQTVKRVLIQKLREVTGLSSHRLVFEDTSEEALLVVRYSHRQDRVVSVIKFVIEQQIEARDKGRDFVSHLGSDKDADEIYQENLLQPLKEAQASVAGNKMTVIWRLLSYLLPYRRRVMLGVFGAVMMTMVSLVPAFLTGYLIDYVIKPFQAGQLTRDAANSLVVVTISGLICIYLFRELFAWIRLKTMSILGEYVARDLRDEVYTHLHKLSLSFFSSKQTGSIISRVGSDTDRIWDFVAFGVVEVFTSTLMLVALAGVLITMDWPLGLMVTLPVPIILWSIARHGQKMQGLFLRAWRKWSSLTDCLSDTIPGVKVVKAFNREDHETERFQGRNTAVTDEFNRIHKAWTGFWPMLMLSIQAVILAVWVFGVPRVLDHIAAFNATGEVAGLSPGVFVSFVLYMGMFVHPIEIIGQMARMVNRATSSAHRVFEVLDTEPQIIEVNDPVKVDHIEGAVEFDNVTFSYDGVRKIIKGISFDVKPGEMIGLVGTSGSGKSTLTNLMARFYEIDSGVIRIDGVDLAQMELGTYRQKLGMVLQDPYLFHGSILENIRYARPEATAGEVIEAARAANAHDFICNLTHGYDTIVGERGQTLSGGERQRVSIARAILRDPRILILDEATSAVDTETERKIQQALDRLVSGRTVFAIAHRLSTLQKADRLLVVDKGRIAEQGTHAELMKIDGGVYRKLVHMQQELAEVKGVGG